MISALRKRFPNSRITHIYASTEAGAAFSVRDGREGFPATFLDNYPGDVQIQLREGRLFIKNLMVKPCYLGTGVLFADAKGFVDTGDMVEKRGDRFFFLGRVNGMINVGGDKVYPEEVERVLLGHPRVHLASVSGKKSPITGAIVVAKVMPEMTTAADPEKLYSELQVLCKEQLPPWKRPAIIKICDNLKNNFGGKIER